MTVSRQKLVVLPDAQRLEEALIAAASSNGGFVDGSGFCTFGQLVGKLGGPEHLGRRPCSPLASRVVVWSTARELGPGPFGTLVNEPFFARAALGLFSDLKLGQLSPREFSGAVEGTGERARYLARLYAAYERRMEALKLADREDRLRGALLLLLEKGLPTEFRRYGEIEISGLYDFPALRLELVIALAQQCDRHGIGFRLRIPASGNPYLDAAVDPVLAQFERRGQEWTHVEVYKDLAADAPPLSSAPFAASGRVAAFSAGTTRDEARQIARRVKRLLEQGTPPEHIAIAHPELDEEVESLLEALDEVGIPARVHSHTPLRQTAVGWIALSLPLLPEEDFPADRVSRFLCSRYVPAISSNAPHAPSSLLALASIRDDRLGATASRGAYEVRLSALKARFERRGWSGRAKEVAALLECCQQLFSITRQIAATAPAQKLLQQWWSCLGDLELPDAIRRPQPRQAEGAALGRHVLSALARDQATFEALRALVLELDGALRLSGTENQNIARRNFHRWLLDAALDFNLPAKGFYSGAVSVLSLRQLVGRKFSHAFIAGLTEGRFPARQRSDPLFNDEERWALNRRLGRDVFRLQSGEDEGRTSWRMAEDRLLFSIALACARGGVTLSFARASRGGQASTPSPFLEELLRATNVKLEYLPLRAVPRLEDVDNEQDLRQRIALETSQRFTGEPWYQEAREQALIEEERLRFFSDPSRAAGPFTGRVSGADVQKTLEALFRFGPDHPLSASALGQFGNCAFQGFLAYGLKLPQVEDPGEEMDAMARGTFWHRVLESLIPQIVSAGLLNRPVEEIPTELIDRALSEAAEELEQSRHVGHPALWALAKEKARSMVRRLLRAPARGLPFEGHLPKHTELRFGRPDAPHGWREVRVPGPNGEPDIYVEGKIDRVDEGNGSLAILDYKSSRLETGKRLAEKLLKTDFQLPLYLYAARLSGQGGALRAAWLSLRDGKHYELEDALREEVLRKIANEIHRLVGAVRSGEFPIRPADCAFCSFRTVCRISAFPVGEVLRPSV